MRTGVDEELERMADEFLLAHDQTPPRERLYLTERQMRRRQKREISVSCLPKGLLESVQNKFYAIFHHDTE